jgi:hypothetical protein
MTLLAGTAVSDLGDTAVLADRGKFADMAAVLVAAALGGVTGVAVATCVGVAGFVAALIAFAGATGVLAVVIIFFGFFGPTASFFAAPVFVCASFCAGWIGAGFFAAVLGAVWFADWGAAVAGLPAELPDKGDADCAKADGANATSIKAAMPLPSRQLPQAIRISDRSGVAPAVSWPDQLPQKADHSMSPAWIYTFYGNIESDFTNAWNSLLNRRKY